MKLFIENIDPASIQLIKEEFEEAGEKKRVYRLKGPFLSAEEKNRNGRIYPLKILQKEVVRYNKESIETNRACGTLDHDPQPTINLDRISHVIESLVMDGNVGYGCARIIDTPCGRIAQNLMDAGVSLGMSTRGVGSLNGGYVGEDFQLISAGDIVQTPSCQRAYVESVYEGKEWIAQGDTFVEAAIDDLKRNMDKKYDSFGMSNHALTYLNEFIAKIGRRK